MGASGSPVGAERGRRGTPGWVGRGRTSTASATTCAMCCDARDRRFGDLRAMRARPGLPARLPRGDFGGRTGCARATSAAHAAARALRSLLQAQSAVRRGGARSANGDGAAIPVRSWRSVARDARRTSTGSTSSAAITATSVRPCLKARSNPMPRWSKRATTGAASETLPASKSSAEPPALPAGSFDKALATRGANDRARSATAALRTNARRVTDRDIVYGGYPWACGYRPWTSRGRGLDWLRGPALHETMPGSMRWIVADGCLD